MTSLDEMKQAYLTYRTMRYLMENPRATQGRARKYARVAWGRKMEAWKKQGLIITELAPGIYTNADPKALPRYRRVENAEGTTSYMGVKS